MNYSIDLSKVVIARKLSILEYDMKRYGLSYKEAVDRYRKMGADTERILSSHERQHDGFQKILSSFEKPNVVEGEVLEKSLLKEASLLIIFGGDNYFQYVSHFVDNQLVLGINADPVTSEGALLGFDSQTLGKFLADIVKGNCLVEKWTRLCASINAKAIDTPAVSEVYIGAKERLNMSRYLLNINGEKVEHKDSGVIIATGAGSTGWFRSAASCEHEKADIFSKTEEKACFICTESYFGKLSSQLLTKGEIDKNGIIKITWFGHEDGVLSIDSQPKYGLAFPLERGSCAEITLSDKPLSVISLKK